MNFRRNFIKFPFAVALAGSLALTALPSFAQSVTLLNVSNDPTPGLYVEFNEAFAKYWDGRTTLPTRRASTRSIRARKPPPHDSTVGPVAGVTAGHGAVARRRRGY